MRKIIIGILVLLAVLAMPTVSALNTTLYFDPQDSNVVNYDDTIELKVMAYAPDGVNAIQFAINHSSSCAEIVDVDYSGCGWTLSDWNKTMASECWGPGHDWLTMWSMADIGPGHVHLCNITIRGNATGYCETGLNFMSGLNIGGCPLQVSNTNDALQYNTTNGTFTCGTPSVEVDLNVTDIDVNPNCNTGGNEIFVNESNEICATVYNAGPGDITGNFDVSFYDDANSVNMGTATVTSGLLTGANTTVCIYWTPSSTDYPDLSGEHPAIGIPATVNATVDCNGAVTETDETNNTLLLNTEVSANGYKSKNFDSDPLTEPLEKFKYEGDLFTGGLAYNVSGVKAYPFAPGDNQTRIHHIDLPSGTTVKDARLYIVWYDYFNNPVPGCLANLSVYFTGPGGSATFTTPDAMYTDQKAYDGYDTPKGKYAYNVTSLVTDTSNDYSVNVENIDPTNSTTLLGGILVVVYEGGEEEIQLWWQEGCDLLSGRTTYCSSTTEATATVALPGSINLATVDSANLITFVDQGMTPGSNLLFNGINIKTDAWDAPTEAYTDSKINIENESVSLLASGNNMGFQDTGTAGMQANLAFLVVKKKSGVIVGIDCGTICSDPSSRTTLPITLYGISDYGTGTINLIYNPAIVDVTDVTGSADSTVSAWNKITDGHIKISAMNTNGVSGDIVFANVEFAPTGLPAQCSDLNILVDTLYDTNVVPLEYTTQNCSICIYETEPPVVTDPTADPVVILNDNGRARVANTNISTLSVQLTDDTGVSSVTIDLSPIKGPGHEAVAMSRDSGTDKNGVWKILTNADFDPGVNSTHCLVVNATDVHGNSNPGI